MFLYSCLPKKRLCIRNSFESEIRLTQSEFLPFAGINIYSWQSVGSLRTSREWKFEIFYLRIQVRIDAFRRAEQAQLFGSNSVVSKYIIKLWASVTTGLSIFQTFIYRSIILTKPSVKNVFLKRFCWFVFSLTWKFETEWNYNWLYE